MRHETKEILSNERLKDGNESLKTSINTALLAFNIRLHGL